MKYHFRNLIQGDIAAVSGEFIDRYMPVANGEYVRVYLYMLRHIGEDMQSCGIADALNMLEGDVQRAIGYWEKQGEISRDADLLIREQAKTDETGEVYEAAGYEDEIYEETLNTDAEKQREEGFAERAGLPEVLPSKDSVDISGLKGDEEFSTLLYCIQKYLSRIFNQTELETVAYLYDVLGMEAELIEYLVELCVQRGKTSMRYIEAIALDWHAKGIRTVEHAKRDAAVYGAETWAVMKAFGISGRNPGSEEQKLIQKWFREYGFTRDIVEEACRRTLAATQKPSFQYADSILASWKKADIRRLSDIDGLDSAHEEKARKNRPSRQVPVSRFSNFEQRNDDLDNMVLDRLSLKLKQG